MCDFDENTSERREFDEKYIRTARFGKKVHQNGEILMKTTSESRDFEEKYVRMARS